MFSDNMSPIREGPVEICFTKSGVDKLKITWTVDLAKTDLSPEKAGQMFNGVTQVLRQGLGVKLEKCR